MRDDTGQAFLLLKVVRATQVQVVDTVVNGMAEYPDGFSLVYL